MLERIRALEHFNNRKKAADELTRNHIFYQLINSTDIAQLMAQYPQLDFSFVFDCHRLFLIQLEKDFFFPAPFTDILPKDSYLVNLNPAQNLLFFAGAKHHLPWYQNLADKMRSYMIKEYGINARIAMSQPITHPKDLPAAFKEMEQYLMDQFFFSKNTLLSAEIPAPDITETVPETDDTLLKDIQTAIGLKDAFSVEKNLSLLLDSCKKRPNVSYIYFRFLCTNILKLLLDGLAENSGRSFESYAHLIYQSKHISEIEALLLPLVKRLSAKLEKEQDAPNYALCMVKQYIHKHYGEDLSLDILAKEVYLTPHYLSALFIEETGCGINRYIKNVRMEKAKDLLLHTNLKINDICRQVGYSNLSYFCKSFAEEFGTTPNNYRNSTSAERKPK